MTFYNYTIPPADTTYTCRAFSFPPGCAQRALAWARARALNALQAPPPPCSVPLHALRFEPLLDPRGAP